VIVNGSVFSVQCSVFNEYPIMTNSSMKKTKKKKTKIVFNWKIIIYGILLGIFFVLITWVCELKMLFKIWVWEMKFKSFVFDIKLFHTESFQWWIDIGVFMFGFLIFFIGGLVNYRILKKRREKRRKLKIQKMQTN